MRQEKISKKHGKLLWIAKICYSIWLKLTATQALYITFDPSLILAGFFFAWLSWSNNNGTNLFRIWILYAGNYYKPVNLKKFFQLCLPFYHSSSPSLQNLCCCLAVLRGRSWLVSCPHGVNLLTNQLRPLKKVKQQQPKFFDNNRRSKINMKFHLKFWRETNNFQTRIFWACVSVNKLSK